MAGRTEPLAGCCMAAVAVAEWEEESGNRRGHHEEYLVFFILKDNGGDSNASRSLGLKIAFDSLSFPVETTFRGYFCHTAELRCLFPRSQQLSEASSSSNEHRIRIST